jgi:signal transduction histidine kinase
MLKYLFRQAHNQSTSSSPQSGMAKQFLSLFLPLTALVGTGLVAFYQFQTHLIRSEIASTERREVDVKAASFANRFNTIRADLMGLAEQHELQVILDSALLPETVQKFRAALAEEYLAVSQQKQQYDQIRFLDASGQEVVRVNFNQGQPSIVPDQRLQNQAKHHWFKDALALQNGEVFMSPLDLNIDFGKIEQPLKPVIRFGTPVFDAEGSKRGIVVLNYLADAFLQDLAPATSLSSGQMSLLNAEGYWLKGTNPEDEWGFMYDDRRDRTLANTSPETWQQIQAQKTGQFYTPQGLHTFTTIYPLLDIREAQSSTGSTQVFGSSQAQVDAESYYWKLVTHVPTAVLTQRTQAIRNQLLLLLVGLTGLIALGSWLLVQARTKRQQSEQTAKSLAQTLQDVHRHQAQLVQTEKMASLGQLVAGVAHEINNPVNFIYGNLCYTDEYAQTLLKLIQLYQKHYPHPVPEIQTEVEAVDLAFVQEDLPKLLASMQIGADRIRQIVLSLRNFSRMDEADCKAVDIHEGLESTLLILQHRLKAKPERPAIEIIKNYSNLPLVECYSGQLNQVFMNILANSIDTLEEMPLKRVNEQWQAHSGYITISTSRTDSDWVQITIADNGAGMTEETRHHLFNPFFTTKPIGKGTGMGMSISHQIITGKHSGKLKCDSTLGKGTEFLIQIPIRQS